MKWACSKGYTTSVNYIYARLSIEVLDLKVEITVLILNYGD